MLSTRRPSRVLVVVPLTLLLTAMMSGWSPGSSGSWNHGSSGPGTLLAQAPVPSAQPDPSTPDRLLTAMHGISSNVILDWVKELASDTYGGRLTGTPGYDASAAWTVNLLQGWKYQPAGDAGTYYQEYANPYTLVKPGTELKLHVPVQGGGTIFKSYVWEQEFFQGSTSDSGTITAETVYVGYGITAHELRYDDYAGVDVKGKIVVVEAEVPMGPEPNADLARPRQDAAHFLWAHIPSVSIGTSGAPPLPYASYHTTRDRWEILTPEIMEDLARIVFLSTVELANK
jgi:hypothetical protein